MNGNSDDILVLIEHSDNQIDSLSLQLLHKARQLADRTGFNLTALILGSGLERVVDNLTNAGADKILVLDNPQLDPYNPELFTRVLTEMIKSANPSLVFIGYTFLGMEVGPAVAARLAIPLVSNCVDFDLGEDGKPVVIRPAYNGTMQVKMRATLPLIVSFQKGALAAGSDVNKPANLVKFSFRDDNTSLRTLVKEVLRPAAGEIDITKAPVIVGAGRGVGQPSNLSAIKALASSLGGVIAATRPVIDMGWLPPEYLVGLSGKTVNPRVYIACGISGAAQHLAGMSESQMIVAINKDASAPIFAIAHYGIVGDLFQIVPAIISEIGMKKQQA